MKKKVLIVTTSASMIQQFCMPSVELYKNLIMKYMLHVIFMREIIFLQEMVQQFITSLDEKRVIHHEIPFSRKMTDLSANISCYHQLKNLVLKEKYAFIHCHTPIAGVITRFVGNSTKTKVIYTAHGFHFLRVHL